MPASSSSTLSKPPLPFHTSQHPTPPPTSPLVLDPPAPISAHSFPLGNQESSYRGPPQLASSGTPSLQVFLTPSLPSYASYLVWKDLGGGFRQPLALPLGLYAVQLAISWTILILFFAAHNTGLALLHLLLLYGLVVSMALIWHPINKLAALLLLPYLAWLTVTASITYHLWKDSLCPGHQPQPTQEKGD
ncbi:translocator protein 2 isoform X1 [Choloepus didactylus]|uniref:translocator protein 2 isoform X1 n=1 Tax=Choloepus didactylus TaxID=27675 RepID=UPI00189D85CF|nr:translocator protein 2 isoform X1 [Choloepus didactylus]